MVGINVEPMIWRNIIRSYIPILIVFIANNIVINELGIIYYVVYFTSWRFTYTKFSPMEFIKRIINIEGENTNTDVMCAPKNSLKQNKSSMILQGERENAQIQRR